MCIITCTEHQPSVWAKITFIALGAVRDWWRSRTSSLLAQLKPQNYSAFLHDFHNESFNTHTRLPFSDMVIHPGSHFAFLYTDTGCQTEIESFTNSFLLPGEAQCEGCGSQTLRYRFVILWSHLSQKYNYFICCCTGSTGLGAEDMSETFPLSC